MNYSTLIANLLSYAKDDFQGNEGAYTAYNVIITILIVIMAIAAVASIVLILLQPGNSDGIDALGGSSETFYGKNKGRSIESKLKMWTYICLGVLGVLAIVFFILQIPGIWGLNFGTAS